MDNSSYFIKNKAIFGSFPSQKSVEELEKEGVRFFVDLTTTEEKLHKIKPYITQYTYINYPIMDRFIPTNHKKYAKFIINICETIKNLKDPDKIYISCRGGHGRAGVVVASILCYLYNFLPEDALEMTRIYHGNRKILKDKWRKIGSPQTFSQKKFIFRFFTPLKYHRTFKNSNIYGFSNFTDHTVHIEGLGLFPNAEAAFQCHKNLDDIDYINNQINSKNVVESKKYGNKIKVREDWDSIKIEIMEKVLRLKIEQHEDVRSNLLNTSLRPIIEHTRDDCFWGDNGDGTGFNIRGKLLTKIRNDYYQKLEF